MCIFEKKDVGLLIYVLVNKKEKLILFFIIFVIVESLFFLIFIDNFCILVLGWFDSIL